MIFGTIQSDDCSPRSSRFQAAPIESRYSILAAFPDTQPNFPHDPLRDLRASSFNPILLKSTRASCGIIARRFKDQFPPWDATSRGANGLNPPSRWVVNLRCYLLSLLRIQHPDCELCNAPEKYGEAMRRRLEELNWRTQPHSHGDHGEVVKVFDSKPAEVISTPVSLAQQEKEIA